MTHSIIKHIHSRISQFGGLKSAFVDHSKEMLELVWAGKSEILTLAERPQICSDLGPKFGQPRPYGRKILLEVADLVIVIAHWAPKVSCAPHNHAGGFGWVCLLDGDRFTETQWELAEEQIRPKAVKRYYACEHQNVLSVDREVLHSMACSTEGVSLHFYRPDVAPKVEQLGMLVPDRSKGLVFEMDHDCADGTGGAWLPPDTLAVKRIFTFRSEQVGSKFSLSSGGVEKDFLLQALPQEIRKAWEPK
jgi:predicted metal-dependent enzyme (double-stranded beta helix superfamily)